jgi:hypothetical protein
MVARRKRKMYRVERVVKERESEVNEHKSEEEEGIKRK